MTNRQSNMCNLDNQLCNKLKIDDREKGTDKLT